MPAEYIAYKGEKIIAEGTAQEIADQLGVTKLKVYKYAYEAQNPRGDHRGNRTVAVRVN
jgi:hypothetical protein